MKSRFLLLIATVSASLTLAACGGGSNGGSGGGGTGTASFSVTDAPADDVDNVFVTFDRVDIKPQDGEMLTFELDEPRQIDLLSLQGTNAAPLLEDIELPAGDYNFVRLFIDGGCESGGTCVSESGSTDSYVTETAGGQFGLFIPGDQPPSRNPNDRFVQLVSPFTITAGGNADFTIDVDLRKALVKIDGGPPTTDPYYLLRPALRIVDNSEVGSITGTVGDLLVMDETTCSGNLSSDEGNAVYLYADSNATPGDVFVDEQGDPQTRTDDAAHPITVANVRQNGTSGDFEYTIGFVPAGEYTLAFTCQAVDDDPAAEDTLVFEPQKNVTVQEGQPSTVEFAASDIAAE